MSRGRTFRHDTAGKTVFENIELYGYVSGDYNMGSFYNYGPANAADSEGSNYTVEFKNCQSYLTLVCTTGNAMGGLLGHGYEGADYTLTIIKDELTDVPNILNKELSNNNMKFNSREELDEIKGYLDTFLKEDTSNKIIVLPGLRGVGKTTLILQAYEYLLKEKNIPPNNVLYISFDDLNDLVECNIRQMVEVYLKNIFHANLRNLDEKVFIFVDESQIDKKWASSGKVIYDKSYNIFMIFTGSSALHLERSDDLARRMRKK